MKLRAVMAAVLGSIVVVLLTSGPSPASADTPTRYEIVTVSVSSADAPTRTASTVRAAGPEGEILLCDRLYAFGDRAGEFTLQHQCGGNTAPWGYRIADPLKAIALSPVSEQGVDWSRNGVRQPRMAPHVEAADYIFHGTFPTARTARRSPMRTTSPTATV